MTAISRSRVKIWIAPLGTAASTLINTGTTPLAPIVGEIKSYAKSGGEDQTDSTPVFGGYVDEEKPTSQVELSFDVIPSLENGTRFDALINGVDVANAGVYTMASQAVNRTIFIQATDGSNHFSWGFNNCNAVSYTNDHAADGNRMGKLSFKFSPTNSNGVSNYMAKTVVATSLPAWTALDNN
jgi:hypothetical protein